MSMSAHRQRPPTPEDAAIARSTGLILSRYAGIGRPLTLRMRDGEPERSIELPAGAVELLSHVLEAMAAGQGVTLIPENAELTTVQAADVLNVSRPYLIKLLDRGAIPHRKTPPHPHGRRCGLQGRHRPGTGAGARPADPGRPGS